MAAAWFGLDQGTYVGNKPVSSIRYSDEADATTPGTCMARTVHVAHAWHVPYTWDMHGAYRTPGTCMARTVHVAHE
jgi:hypothetical protein